MKNYEEIKKKFCCALAHTELCCADELERAAGGRQSNRSETGRNWARDEVSGPVLSELFGGTEGEPVQVELSGVRILFELLGFLLSVQDLA